MAFVYTSFMPVGTNFPANDRPLMTANSQYLSAWGDIDHQFTANTGNSNDGIHKQVTLGNQASSGVGGGDSRIYANSANGDSQLFLENASGAFQVTAQITNVPSVNLVAQQGVSYLPGGQLIQWGYATTGFTITYLVAFSATPTIRPIVTVTPYQIGGGTPSTLTAPTVITPAVADNVSFTVQNNGGDTINFYWMAIGEAS